MGNDLNIRRWRQDDCRIIYEWRIHPDNCRWFAEQKHIKYSEHEQWFARTLDDQRVYCFILEQHKTPVAQIRFNPAEMPGCYRIAISVASNMGGKGLGSWLLRASCQSDEILGSVSLLVAETLVDNLPSQKIFARNGFIKAGKMHRNDRDFLFWALPIGVTAFEPVSLQIFAESEIVDACESILCTTGLGRLGDDQSPMAVFFDSAADQSGCERGAVFHFNRVNGQCILDLATGIELQVELPIAFHSETIAVLQTLTAFYKSLTGVTS